MLKGFRADRTVQIPSSLVEIYRIGSLTRIVGVTVFIVSLYFVLSICHLQKFYHLLRGCLFNLGSLFFSYWDECSPMYF